jgi:hypothetical protein
MNFDEFRARQQETTIDGLKISFVDEGQGPVLLLIHGILSGAIYGKIALNLWQAIFG